jgi:hypothetical protein
MERVGDRAYRCTMCDAVINVESDAKPVVVIAAHSGKAPERVVTVGVAEIHRCEILPVGATGRMAN